jgi:hypothetical protein
MEMLMQSFLERTIYDFTLHLLAARDVTKILASTASYGQLGLQYAC